MIIDWLVFIILVAVPTVYIILGFYYKGTKPPRDLLKFYLYDNLPFLIPVVVILILNFSLINPDISDIDQGFPIEDKYISLIAGIFLVPFFIAFLPTDTNFPKEDIRNVKEIFGFDTALMPNNLIQLAAFFFFIVIGVVLEEIFFRQFMFSSFHTTLNIEGDWLVVITAIMFGVGHLYQGVRGFISSFLLGLATGKVYLLTGNILIPIIMHLSINLTIVVYAIRRMIALNRLKKKGLY
ncbi:MAG: CPBP family intramembrane metalloprotease [Saprospirales bacterium]|nr:MAG: CPBP family intramembrane metalloprotease [Saprospirales bacterium]